MINKFDPNTPATESRLLSEPIRNNFNALNDRTNQLTPAATFPVTTSVRIGTADKIYFEDNVYVPFPGGLLDLGSISTGVSAFNTPGTFKEIVVYYYNLGGSGTLGFIESLEKFTKVRDTQSLINNALDQVDPMNGPNGSGDPNLLKGRIPICSIMVTNNGTASQRGQIVQIGDIDILDIRPFMQRGGGTEDLDAHVNAPTLAQAHPSALIDNASLIVTGRGPFSTVPTVATPVIAGSKQIFVSGNVNLFAVGQFLRIPTSAVSVANIGNLVEFVTCKIVFIDSGVSPYVIVDRELPAIPAGRLLINGQITLDRMGFDVATALAEVTMDTFLRIETNVNDESEYKLGLDIVFDENVAPTAAIAGTKIDPNFGTQNITTSGIVTLTNTTQSTTITTGALVVSGGVGIAKNATVGEQLTVIGFSDLNTVHADGYIRSATNIIADGYLQSTSSTNATSLVTGALRTSGGAAVTLDLRIGGLVYAGSSTTQLTDTTGKILSTALNTVQIAQGGTGLTVLGTANQVLGANAGATAAEYKSLLGTTNRVTVTHGVGTVTFSAPQDIHTAASPTFAGLTLTGFSGPVYGSAGVLASEAQLSIVRGGTGLGTTPTNGQLLIGNGTGYTLATVTGTTDQVNVVNGAGSITLSTPQSIAITSSPTFANLTVSGLSTGVVYNTGGLLASEAQLSITRGGTGQSTATAGFDALAPTTTSGDIIYRGVSSNTRLGIGSVNEVLASTGSAPDWILLTNSNLDPAANIARTKIAAGTASHVVINDPSGVLSSEANLSVTRGGTGVGTLATGQLVVGAGTGPVTSIAFASANTPSTIVQRDGSGNFSAGTITATLSGNATNVTGVVAIANGGTGQTTAAPAFTALAPVSTLGALIYKDTTNYTSLSVGAANEVLTVSGGLPTWSLIVDDSISNAAAIARAKIAAGTASHVVINDPSGVLSSEANLSVTRGGTGVGTFTTGNLLLGNGTGPIAEIQHAPAPTPDTVVSRDNVGSFSGFDVSATNQFLADDGTTLAPGFAFTSDASTGLSSSAGNNIELNVAGSLQLEITPTNVQFYGGMRYKTSVFADPGGPQPIGVDEYIILTIGSSAQTLELPTAIPDGTSFRFYCNATADTTIITSGGDIYESTGKVGDAGFTFLDPTTLVLTQGESAEIVFIGSTWYFMSFLTADGYVV